MKLERKKRLFKLVLLFWCCTCIIASAQNENLNYNKFKQLGQELPTPNVYRTASGAPGHAYWQQQADYKMDIELNDQNQSISGAETITYHNNSPDQLNYLWLQLDQNRRAKDSDSYKINTNKMSPDQNIRNIKRLEPTFDGGFKIESVTDVNGKTLKYVVNKTMMRVDLPESLKSKGQYTFKIKWWYNINNRKEIGGRSGFEYFPEDENYLYTIAQYFPRMCVYDEIQGWQHKQFLGSGEFTLSFGDYDVSITVPEDHQVSATGTLQNPQEVLSNEQIKRLEEARKSETEPVFIVTPKEALANESKKAKGKKTWKFKAQNVRDFAFASSRKFMWDAMGVPMSNGEIVMAMSMYPKEGNPLWERYSTKSVAHTLKWFSHYTFDYPYPVAWSIHTDRIGMEYPMICFNGGRPEKDGTYTKRTKYGLISVIIHEVGHNYFPMIVNSDERQWTWMDEGLNTFLQFLTEQEWERDYPSRRGDAHKIVDYMKGDKNYITPIMTNSESIFQFGNNAYGKPATALNILRETVMGRELFDFAFKEYSNRWKFKHPSPADFFRTMEDASGVDLDWFWRGWFYTTDHVDLSIDNVKWFQPNSKNPEEELSAIQKEKERTPQSISSLRNEKIIVKTQDEIDRSLRDFYTDYDPAKANVLNKDDYFKYINSLSEEEQALLQSNKNFYEISFSNIGGLVMPLIIEFQYSDGSKEIKKIPAEIWRKDQTNISKVFITEKEVKQFILDPHRETADIETNNNYFPRQQQMNRFELYKERKKQRKNPMQKMKDQKMKKSGTN